jgi:hypothetical protein
MGKEISMRKKPTRNDINEARKPEILIEKDKWGEYKVIKKVKDIKIIDGKIEKEYGVITRIMKKPSAEYKKKMEKRKKEQAKVYAEQKKIDNANKLIQERIKQNAKQQLIDEGVLDKNGMPVGENNVT